MGQNVPYPQNIMGQCLIYEYKVGHFGLFSCVKCRKNAALVEH